jgi:hypothetical protein
MSHIKRSTRANIDIVMRMAELKGKFANARAHSPAREARTLPSVAIRIGMIEAS